MLNGTPLDPQPLPPGAFEAACDAVVRQGYDQRGILEGYTFAAAAQPQVRINAMVFAHPFHRNPAEYASFTFLNAPEHIQDADLVRTLAQSAAPFHLIHRGQSFAFWGSTAVAGNGGPTAIPMQNGISYANLTSALSDYGVDISPEKLVSVKRGLDTFSLPAFREIFPLQLSLWALDVTRPLLKDHFGHAMDVLRNHHRHDGTSLPESDVIALAIQLLGACILWDAGVIQRSIPSEEPDLLPLIQRAAEKFHRYFDVGLFRRYEPAAELAFTLMRHISFAGFVPDMLTDLYRAAYGKEESRELGRYDTPLYLTRRIWEHIPVEFLPPDQRVIADMSCGWGSFLIAGYERLAELPDMPEESIRNSLAGNERDQFTAQLAGLGLLVSTSVDSWHVEHGDALKWPWLMERQPNLIVGNPPFGGNRKDPIPDAISRTERANNFLSLAIDRLSPGGYLAMVMPMSFVAAEASPALRTKLLEQCDLLELWEFPANVFEGASVRAVVILAQKRSRGADHAHGLVRVASIQGATVAAFRDRGTFAASAVVDQRDFWNPGYHAQRTSNENVFFWTTVLSAPEWNQIKQRCLQLSERAHVFQGASLRGPRSRPRKYGTPPRTVKFLRTAKRTVPRSFDIRVAQAEERQYPTDFEEAREHEGSLLSGTKVIVLSVADPSWGRRVTLAIDRGEHCVSQGFWVVAPLPGEVHPSSSPEVIAAVLGWYVCNAWIVEHLKSPYIRKSALLTVPFPADLSDDACKKLTDAVHLFEDAAERGVDEPEEARDTLDGILCEAYHLSEVVYERLRTIYQWDSLHRVTLEPEPDASKATWKIGGIIHDVNIENRTVTLWIEGFEDLVTTPIVPAMPGWLLRPQTSFRTALPRTCVRERNLEGVVWGRFKPQPFSYMSEPELLDHLSDILEANSIHSAGAPHSR